MNISTHFFKNQNLIKFDNNNKFQSNKTVITIDSINKIISNNISI